MSLQFIEITRNDDTSSLSIGSRDATAEQPFRVIGNLPHNAAIGPRTVADAQRWIGVLERWIEQQQPAKQTILVNQDGSFDLVVDGVIVESGPDWTSNFDDC